MVHFSPPTIGLFSNTYICRQACGLHANEYSVLHAHFPHIMLLCNMQLPTPISPIPHPLSIRIANPVAFYIHAMTGVDISL